MLSSSSFSESSTDAPICPSMSLHFVTLIHLAMDSTSILRGANLYPLSRARLRIELIESNINSEFRISCTPLLASKFRFKPKNHAKNGVASAFFMFFSPNKGPRRPPRNSFWKTRRLANTSKRRRTFFWPKFVVRNVFFCSNSPKFHHFVRFSSKSEQLRAPHRGCWRQGRYGSFSRLWRPY